MSKVEAFFTPKTLDEALSILALKRGDVAPVAGSTSIGHIAGLRKRFLMGLGGLGLDGIELDGQRARIGAMVPLAALEAHEGLNAAFPSGGVGATGDGVFRAVTRRLGSTLLRRMITAGGNAFQVFAWSELPVVLLALGARFVLRRSEGERVLTADEFYAAHPRSVLRPDELLVAIEVPLGVSRVVYERFSSAESEYSIVTLCLARRPEGVRAVVGALSTVPRRLPGLEARLSAPPGPVTAEALSSIIRADLPALQAALPYSPEYRLDVATGLLLEAVRSLDEVRS
jgi:xanthine dehydrogenase small subunit